MQVFNLDLTSKTIIPILHAKQGDVGRKFQVVLTDRGTGYPVPDGSVVSVWFHGASGEGNYTQIGEESAVSVDGNKITVEMIAQMLINAGHGMVCLAIVTTDGDQIGTWNIPYFAEPLPGMGSEQAKTYYTAFSKAIEALYPPDTTLSVAGKAADAAAVGKELDALKDSMSEVETVTVDRELSETSENPVQNKVVTENFNIATQTLQEVVIPNLLPTVTEEDKDKILQVVDGVWVKVTAENSVIKTYVEDYLNEALGGDY